MPFTSPKLDRKYDNYVISRGVFAIGTLLQRFRDYDLDVDPGASSTS
jgi:hypothetical protein